MTTLPTYDEIVALHKKYAPNDKAFQLLFTHCQIVWDIAEQLIEAGNLGVDKDLVKAACLLHDIGVYRLFQPDGALDHKNYITHGTLGYEVLKAEGFDEKLCRFASHHTGVGLSKNEIVADNLPLPREDFYAETPEEELVMYSDKFHTKSTPPKLMTADEYATFVGRFGEEKVARFREMQNRYGTPNLELIAEKYQLVAE